MYLSSQSPFTTHIAVLLTTMALQGITCHVCCL